jgi:hypothetical protein
MPSIGRGIGVGFAAAREADAGMPRTRRAPATESPIMKSGSIFTAALAVLTGLLACQAAPAAALSPRPPMDKQALLKKWTAVPDLLFLAREQAKDGDAYALLKTMEAEYRRDKKVFQITTLFRSKEGCKSGEHEFTRATIAIVNPKGERFETTGLLRHEIEVHHADFPPALADFLKPMPDSASATPLKD